MTYGMIGAIALTYITIGFFYVMGRGLFFDEFASPGAHFLFWPISLGKAIWRAFVIVVKS